MLFILGKTLSVMEKIIISGIYVIKGGGGHLLDRGRLTQNSIQRWASIRYGAFIGSWVFIRSFTVHLYIVRKLYLSMVFLKSSVYYIFFIKYSINKKLKSFNCFS